MRAASSRIFAALIVVVILGAVFLCKHGANEADANSQLYGGLQPIPKNASAMPDKEPSEILSTDFRIVHRLRYVPAIVKKSFCNVQQCDSSNGEFDMVDPGQTMNTDFVLPGFHRGA